MKLLAAVLVSLVTSFAAEACSVSQIDALADSINPQTSRFGDMYQAVRTVRSICPARHALRAYAATNFARTILASRDEAVSLAWETVYLCDKDPRCATMLIEGLVSRIHMARPEITLGFARTFQSIVNLNPYQVVKDTALEEISWLYGSSSSIKPEMDALLAQISLVETITFE